MRPTKRPKTAPRRHRAAPRRPRTAPRRPKTVPRWSQDGPRRPQDVSQKCTFVWEILQNSLQMAPRWPRIRAVDSDTLEPCFLYRLRTWVACAGYMPCTCHCFSNKPDTVRLCLLYCVRTRCMTQ